MSRPLIATIRIPSTEQTPLLQLLDQMAMMLVCLLPFFWDCTARLQM